MAVIPWTTDPHVVAAHAQPLAGRLDLDVRPVADGVQIVDARTGAVLIAVPCADVPDRWVASVWKVGSPLPAGVQADTMADVPAAVLAAEVFLAAERVPDPAWVVPVIPIEEAWFSELPGMNVLYALAATVDGCSRDRPPVWSPPGGDPVSPLVAVANATVHSPVWSLDEETDPRALAWEARAFGLWPPSVL